MRFFPFFAAFALWASSLLHALPSQMEIGGVFSCNFLNDGDTYSNYTSSADWSTEQMEAAARALTTWSNLIGNEPGRSLTVALVWNSSLSGTSALANASSPYSYYVAQQRVPSLQQVNNRVESVWRNGSSAEATGYDIVINCNPSSSFYYGADATGISWSQWDFESVLLHEIGHTMGFYSMATGSGSFYTAENSGYYTTLYTAYDSLMRQADGTPVVPEIIDINDLEHELTIQAGDVISHVPYGNLVDVTYELGSDIYLGDTGLKVYNPTAWQEGSSMSHIANDSDAVMNPSISNQTIQRELSAAEIQLLGEMGWTIALVPEPSSSLLFLVGLGALTARRRRSPSRTL